MRRSFTGSIALLAAAIALKPAEAQNDIASEPWDAAVVPAWNTNVSVPWNTGVVVPWNTGVVGSWSTGVAEPWRIALLSPEPLGYELSPGVTFVPNAFSEAGYDTNPAGKLLNQIGSAFWRNGAGFNFSSVTQRTVATVDASGSALGYFNDEVYSDPFRFAGAAKANLSYVVQPGVTVSPGAFIDYDGQSANKNQIAGGDAELAYRDGFITSIWRMRFQDVQYLNTADAASAPFVLSRAFDYGRSEATWDALLGTPWFAAPYAGVGAARVDYTDQPDRAVLDRSADDYHAKAGVRLRISSELTSDIGWRFNWRDTDDHRVTSYDSNFFDGNLAWRPSPFFNLTASVERTIGEPSTSLAVLADMRTYSVKASYLPVAGVSVSAVGAWLEVSDIGSGVHYHSDYGEVQAAWDYNNHVQFYAALRYQTYGIEWQSTGYDGLRVTAGMRIVPDGRDLTQGESAESLFARLADRSGLAGSALSVSGGYSWFGLPDMKMVTVTGIPVAGPGPTMPSAAIRQETNGEGGFNGWRTDARLANFAEGNLPDGRLLSFSLSGFFANYQGETKSHCMYGLTTDCAIVNIVDFDSTQPNNTGFAGDLNVTVHRNVDYYGAAIDMRSGWADGGSKDGSAAQVLSPFKVGVAVRGLNETANLISVDPQVSVPARYKESVDTHYYGGFAGVEQKQALGGGWSIGADVTAGFYYTTVAYQGRYNGYTLVIPSGYFEETGIVNSSIDRGSFIATARLDLKHELDWGAIGLFGQGEYLGYVPRIAYNNNDSATSYLLGGINGTQMGTHVEGATALNFMAGVSVSVPAN